MTSRTASARLVRDTVNVVSAVQPLNGVPPTVSSVEPDPNVTFSSAVQFRNADAPSSVSPFKPISVSRVQSPNARVPIRKHLALLRKLTEESDEQYSNAFAPIAVSSNI